MQAMPPVPPVPPLPTSKRGLSRGMTALLVVLALLVMFSGFGLIYYSAVYHPAQLHAEATATVQVRLAGHQCRKPIEAALPQFGEPTEQSRQWERRVSLDMSQAIEAVERLVGSLFEHNSDARNPVGNLGRDEVSDDVADCPPAQYVRLTQPTVR